jgi:hypothetical protein
MGGATMASEEDRQLQEIVILLTKRAEAETPLKKGFVDRKLREYPDELIKRATEQMEGMGGLPPIATPETMADAEEFVLLWQEQLLSLRSEMNAVIDTQRSFTVGLSGLAERVPDLVGELPMSLLAEIQKNTDDAKAALEEIKSREQELAGLRSQIKEWRAEQEKGTSKGGAELEQRSAELKNLAEDLLPSLAKRMKAADDRAVEIQTEIVEKMTSTSKDVAARLQMASEEGAAGTYESIKKTTESIASGLSWMVSTFSLGLISENKVTALKVTVNGLLDVVKEGHIGLNAYSDASDLDALLDGMSPYATYLANLHKIKDWVGAGFNLAELVQMVPYIGEWLWKGFEPVKSVFEATIDNQLKYVAKLDKEMSQALEEVKQQGSPSPEQLQEIKQQWLSAGGRLELIWDELKDKVDNVCKEWETHAVEALQTLIEKGVVEGAKDLYDKAVAAIRDTIADLIVRVFPRELPEAVFGFEISQVVKSLAVDTQTDFTEAEKNELATLSA